MAMSTQVLMSLFLCKLPQALKLRFIGSPAFAIGRGADGVCLPSGGMHLTTTFLNIPEKCRCS